MNFFIKLFSFLDVILLSYGCKGRLNPLKKGFIYMTI